ncbi:hypothetical protein H4R19_000097, partial [Coemansia spiralis]
MSVDGEESDYELDAASEDVESKLVQRMAQSEEQLTSLLRLLGTCQEYWADHDYVCALRD